MFGRVLEYPPLRRSGRFRTVGFGGGEAPGLSYQNSSDARATVPPAVTSRPLLSALTAAIECDPGLGCGVKSARRKEHDADCARDGPPTKKPETAPDSISGTSFLCSAACAHRVWEDYEPAFLLLCLTDCS